MVYEPQKYFRAEGRVILNAGESGGRAEGARMARWAPRGMSKGSPQPVETTFGTYPDYVPNLSMIRSEPIADTFRSPHRYVPKWVSIRSEPIEGTFRTYRHYVLDVSMTTSERIETTFGTYQDYVRNVSRLRSERIDDHFGTYFGVFRNGSMGSRVNRREGRTPPPCVCPSLSSPCSLPAGGGGWGVSRSAPLRVLALRQTG